MSKRNAELSIDEPLPVDDMPDDLANIVAGEFRDESGISKGITSITEIKPAIKGQASDIEIKSILSEERIVDHSMVEFMTGIMEMSAKDFETRPVIAGLTEKLERKFLSKDGKAREQVVEMVRGGAPIMQQPQRRGWFGGRR